MPSYFDLVFDIPSPLSFCYLIDDKEQAAIGKRAMAPFGRSSKDTLGYIIGKRDAPPPEIKESQIKKIRRVADSSPLFDEENVLLAKWMADFYLCGIGQALACMIPSGKKVILPKIPETEESDEPKLSISDEQAAALHAITSGDGSKPEIFYLFGVTGSGKTEVFLRAAQFFLNRGKTVIYLVPEISLTHQTAEIIVNRFGSSAATLHSGMTPSERLAEWMRIRKGEANIVVGPRSAVFAPLKNLGLIIIDEEHDSSYKSGNSPRYHARQVAQHRCQTSGARLVMGSATPSCEIWNLMQKGAVKRLNLTRRLSGGATPKIKAVSLLETSGCLTSELKKEIRETAALGKQTILFLNRRGFAHFYHCNECGADLTCKRCSVSLTLHKAKGKCVCHYCGYSCPSPKACPGCGSIEAGYRGFGTEMIEDEVRRAFPDLRLRRIDADTSRGSAGKDGSLETALTLFKAGMIDILLGTQMVAKGLNFPGVRLVGVVLADTGLHLPDFRAAERTFSLIVQVAGRAGRYFPDSKVIVQTMRMADPVIVKSCALDVEGFYNAELEQRKALNFPPYSRVIRFTVRSKDIKSAEDAVNRLAFLSRKHINKEIDMLGPSECPIGVINNNYRRQIILRGQYMGVLHKAAREILFSYDKKKIAKANLEVDIDPVSML